MKYQKLIFIFLFFLLSKLSLFVLSQGTGYFQIQSDPQASIILDDKVIGKIPDTGSLLLKNVPTGTHELQIVKEGYKVHTEIIEIRSNEIQFHSVVLTPKIGALLIEAEPVECTIEIPQLGIDEKNKGKKTGKIWELSSIPIGNYLINLTASNKRVSYSFEIEEEISKCLLVNILDNEVKEIKRVATYNWEKTYGGSKDDEASSIIQTADGNYVVAGYTESKGAGRKDAWILKLDSVGNIIWDKTYGGRENDSINSIIQLNDGNYVVAGYTESKGAGRKDAWILKLDSTGNLIWDKTYGGSSDDSANAIIQTTDGGYAVAGVRDFVYPYGDDSWILKLDSGGNIVWEKTYGHSGNDSAYSIIQTTDGGFVIAGDSFNGLRIFKLSSDGYLIWDRNYDEFRYSGAEDIIQTTDEGYAVVGSTASKGVVKISVLILKLNKYGNLTWSKTYGGRDTDWAHSIIQTADGGFAVAGWTTSKGSGFADFWIAKLDNKGSLVWEKTYGGWWGDVANSIIQTTEENYVVAGFTRSEGAGEKDIWILKLDEHGNVAKVIIDMETKKEVKISEIKEVQPVLTWEKIYNAGSMISLIQTTDDGYASAGFKIVEWDSGEADSWIVKLDSYGNIVWDKTYDRGFISSAVSLIQTTDDGYASAGYSFLEDGTKCSVWFIKLDSNGDIVWEKDYGGIQNDDALYVLVEKIGNLIQTNDGGYVFASVTNSKDSTELTAWVIKLDSNGDIVWEKTYGGSRQAFATSIIQTTDGSFMVSGGTISKDNDNGGAWIFKLDSHGNLIWDKTYGNNTSDIINSIIQTTDGGYAVAGHTPSKGAGVVDIWIFKLDGRGNLVWEKTYSGSGHNAATSFTQTTDNGYAVARYVGSENSIDCLVWILKLDNFGDIIWEKTHGVSEQTITTSIIQTIDGGYAVAGSAYSEDGGRIDAFILKLDSEGNLISD